MLLVLVLSVFLSLLSCNNGCETGCTVEFLHTKYESFWKANKITIVTTTGTPPFLFQDAGGVPYGLIVDLMNYIGFIYRVQFQYQYVAFADLIPLVQNNTNYIAATSLFDTVAREEFVNFVNFFQNGNIFVAKSTFNLTVNGLADLCGKTVVVRAGTLQYQDVIAQNVTCSANPIDIIVVITVNDLISAVLNGTAELGLSNQAVLATAVRESNNELKLVGIPYDVGPYGIACNKQNTQVSCALSSAINYLIRTRTYAQLLKRYSFSYATYGVCPSVINLNGKACSLECAPKPRLCKRYLQ